VPSLQSWQTAFVSLPPALLATHGCLISIICVILCSLSCSLPDFARQPLEIPPPEVTGPSFRFRLPPFGLQWYGWAIFSELIWLYFRDLLRGRGVHRGADGRRFFWRWVSPRGFTPQLTKAGTGSRCRCQSLGGASFPTPFRPSPFVGSVPLKRTWRRHKCLVQCSPSDFAVSVTSLLMDLARPCFSPLWP